MCTVRVGSITAKVAISRHFVFRDTQKRGLLLERDAPGSMQNRFRLIVNSNLLNALGPNSRFEGLTAAQVLDASVVEVGAAGFVPKYDPALRLLDWPEHKLT
jgi:hypothetical protein